MTPPAPDPVPENPLSTPIRVLMVEDNEDDFVLATEYLPRGQFSLEHCTSAASARARLSQGAVDLVLLDHNLPDTNSLSFLQELRATDRQTPVIVLTGQDDPALAVSALNQGATDYILKEEISRHLLTAVQTLFPSTRLPVVKKPARPAERFVDSAPDIYHTLLETMQEGCLVVAADGTVTFANEALERLTGRSRSQLLGAEARALFESQTARRLSYFLDGSAARAPAKLEGVLRHNASGAIDVLISLRALHTQRHRQTGYLLVLTDVSELVRARQEAGALYAREQARNHKLRALHQIMTTVAGLESERLLAQACRLIGELFDYPRVRIGRVDGQSIWIEPQHSFIQKRSLRPPSAPPAAEQLPLDQPSVMSLAVREKRPVTTLELSERQQTRPLSASRFETALPIVLQDRPVAVLAVESPTAEALPADDIMLLRLLVEWLARAVENAGLFQAVADERHRLKALVASSEDGILLLTPQAEIAVINPRAVELLALPESWETWVNRPFSDALLALRAPLPDGFRQKVKQAISDIISQTYASQQGALELQERHLRWNTIPVQSGPEQVGWLLVIKDESQRHEMEQFRQDLTRTMVHDLRNPLSGILNSLEFVEMLDEMNEAPLQARQRKYLTRAEQNARGLLQLVNDILEAYRLESGHVVPRLEQANMAQLIDETCTAQRSIADGKQIELRRRIPADLPLVEADPQLLRRVLQNLLDNAIKFSPHHSVVTVTAAIATLGERQVVHVSVADQGSGIPIELRTRLFDRFTTGGHEASGSGLGLAFCKQAVNAQQGRIWFETPQEGGSMFTFVLPTVSEAGDE